MLYHITEKENVPSILSQGLIPRIGNNSMGIENTPVVCLSRRRDVGYWKILLALKNPAVLSIPEITGLEEIRYDCYEEYKTYDVIPGNIIKVSRIYDTKERKLQINKDLAKSFMFSLHNLCADCAEFYYENRKRMKEKDLYKNLFWGVKMIKRIDFSALSPEEKLKELKNASEDCVFTFSNVNMITNKRLYQLSIYPADSTLKMRLELEEIIRENFAECLNMDTGGWGY